MNRLRLCIVLAILLNGVSVVAAQDNDKLNVVASTTIIADVARNVGGDLVNVDSILPIGADSHTYSPSPADIVKIVDADVVLVNGLNLEESLLEILTENATNEPVIVSTGVQVIEPAAVDHDHEEDESINEADDDLEHGVILGTLGVDAPCDADEAHHEEEEGEDAHHDHGPCDPHIWMNPENVIIWTQNIADAFAVADPANAETYAANAASYISELESLSAELHTLVDTLPEENRILVTNHDFLGYFAAEYDFEIVGTVIPGVSTLAETNPAELAALVEVIKAQGAHAIFAETTSNINLAETLADEVGEDVTVVTLYTESLGDQDAPSATYLDYMRYNVNAIVEALRG
jgi:ABC-type Zn uptake system ZnuABC Zn-binding protein ZnuA